MFQSKIPNRFILLLVFTATGPDPSKAFTLPAFVNRTIDSLAGSDKDEAWCDRIARHPDVFIFSNYNTIPYPFELVKANCTNYQDYKQIFRYFTIFQEVNEPITSGRRLFYVECHIGFASTWLLMGLDSAVVRDSQSAELYFSQNHDPGPNERWREYYHRNRHFFGVEILQYGTIVKIRKGGSAATRLSSATWEQPDIALPAWAFKFLAAIFLPDMVHDVEAYLEKRRKAHGADAF
jgi:hypothetical protein